MLYQYVYIGIVNTNCEDIKMCLEYDWTYGVYRPRFGNTFIDVRGYRSFSSMDEAKQVLSWAKLKLGRKTDTRTWQIELAN